MREAKLECVSRLPRFPDYCVRYPLLDTRLHVQSVCDPPIQTLQLKTNEYDECSTICHIGQSIWGHRINSLLSSNSCVIRYAVNLGLLNWPSNFVINYIIWRQVQQEIFFYLTANPLHNHKYPHQWDFQTVGCHRILHTRPSEVLRLRNHAARKWADVFIRFHFMHHLPGQTGVCLKKGGRWRITQKQTMSCRN